MVIRLIMLIHACAQVVHSRNLLLRMEKIKPSESTSFKSDLSLITIFVTNLLQLVDVVTYEFCGPKVASLTFSISIKLTRTMLISWIKIYFPINVSTHQCILGS